MSTPVARAAVAEQVAGFVTRKRERGQVELAPINSKT